MTIETEIGTGTESVDIAQDPRITVAPDATTKWTRTLPRVTTESVSAKTAIEIDETDAKKEPGTEIDIDETAEGMMNAGNDETEICSMTGGDRVETGNLVHLLQAESETRKRRMTQWDIKPPGYENITAEQAKLSGMFPLPGAPRQQPLDPKQLQAFMGSSGSTANSAALDPTTAKQSKRLFVYNLPPAAVGDENILANFFNLQLNGSNVISADDPCTTCRIGPGGEYAMLEFKTPEDATSALALTGINMYAEEDTDMANGTANGLSSGLDIRRPKDYIAAAAAENAETRPGVIKDSPQKICITNIPAYLDEEQITELIQAFGAVKSFVLAKDVGTEQSKGFAFCEYADPATTDVAVENLNQMELGDQQLRVARASVGASQAANFGGAMGVSAMSMLAGTAQNNTDESTGRVLQLLNMVTPDELMDNSEYQEICEDVREECAKFGELLDMKIPRPTSSGGRSAPGVGKIFLKYDSNASAQKALSALAGRKFADRTVVVTWFSERKRRNLQPIQE
ncbi:MAG: hypothetical protein Q9159_000124 [Coniocarpon cinnabarinum]